MQRSWNHASERASVRALYHRDEKRMAALHTRGLNFTGTLAALVKRSGRATADRVVARVGGEPGEALRRRTITATGWYPVAWYDALLEAIELELPGEPDVCRELARAAVTEDLATVLRALSFVASPDFAIVNATRVASMYWDGGRISVIDSRPRRLHFRFEGYEGFTPRLWRDWVGGMEAVIDALRLERLATEVLLGDDTSRCEVVILYAR